MSFFSAGQSYAVDVLALNEVIPLLEIKPIPKGPDFLEGVINLRGVIVPVVDMGQVFGLDKKEYTLESRILITTIHSKKIGFLVDGAKDILELDQETIESSVDEENRSRFIEGVAKANNGNILYLIGIQTLLDENSLQQLSSLEA